MVPRLHRSMFVPWFGPSLKNASLLSEFGPPGNFGGAISRWEFFQVVSTASLAQTHRCSTDSVEYASRRPGAALRGAQLEGLGAEPGSDGAARCETNSAASWKRSFFVVGSSFW